MPNEKQSRAQRLALDLAASMIDAIHERSRRGVTAPLSAEQNAHLVGLISEKHNLRPKQIEAMIRQAPWALQEVQRVADAITPKGTT
jgi:hypothetical protein